MSYKAQSRNKRATMFYPNLINVGGKTITTGPYRRDFCGKTQEGVNRYFQHLADQYTKAIKN